MPDGSAGASAPGRVESRRQAPGSVRLTPPATSPATASRRQFSGKSVPSASCRGGSNGGPSGQSSGLRRCARSDSRSRPPASARGARSAGTVRRPVLKRRFRHRASGPAWTDRRRSPAPAQGTGAGGRERPRSMRLRARRSRPGLPPRQLTSRLSADQSKPSDVCRRLTPLRPGRRARLIAGDRNRYRTRARPDPCPGR